MVDSSTTSSPQHLYQQSCHFSSMQPTQSRSMSCAGKTARGFPSSDILGQDTRPDVSFWMCLSCLWHRERLWPSVSHRMKSSMTEPRYGNNLSPCWHHWATLSNNPEVYSSFELPVRWANEVPYYLSLNESGFLLSVAKSILAETLLDYNYKHKGIQILFKTN